MKVATALLAFLVFSALAFSATIYVPDDCATIQGAIDASANGDMVIVRPGTYVENIRFYGKEITLTSEQGAAVTTIDGNQYSSVVTFKDGETRNSVLSGFTITNGYATRGGGIFIDSASPTINFNAISFNSSNEIGGGIHVRDANSAPKIKENTISDNSAERGGAIGAIWAYNPIIQYNTITNNSSSSHGGGIFCYECEWSPISHNIISHNSADGEGGGIACYKSWFFIKNNIVSHNSAQSNGGGILLSLSLFKTELHNNCIFRNNTSETGGGIYCDVFDVDIDKSTIVTNSASSSGGIYLYGDNSDVVNCIIRGNTGGNIGGSPFNDITYSNIEGGISGTGNIDNNPLFLDPENDDYHLQQHPCQPGVVNPCVDTGDPTSFLGGSTRTDARPDENIIDMGYHYPSEDVIYVPDHYSTIQEAINISENGDFIVVRVGTYLENIDFLGKSITVESESGPELTIIDGGQAGSVVTFTNGEGPDTRLEGFTITNGTGTYLTSQDKWCGGGILCVDSSPTITGNKISGNSVANNGGGIWCEDSSPLIDHNEISFNIANSAWGGAGIVCYGVSTARISNNHIFDNISTSNGGGLYCTGTSCTPVVDNNVIYNNKAEHGGGIFCSDFAEPEFLNNTVAKNEGTSTGGGLRCTLSCHSTVTNTIFWNNSSPSGKEIYLGNPNPSQTTLDLSYSDVDGGQSSVHVESGCQLNWGDGMIDATPLFSDPAKADFHISRDSPCCNAGYNLGPSLPEEDFEGDPRLAGFVIDIGADEFYTHLYTVGDIVPGDTIEIKVAGIPWFPVALAMDSELQDPPINTIHGDMYLELPALWQGSIGRVPSNGLLVLPITVPTAWSTGETYYLQALVGYWGGPWTRLTNAEVLVVE